MLDADPQPRTAGWMLPRGQGKSSLMGAVPSPLGARAAVIAADLTEVADALLAYGGNPLRSM